MSAVITKRLRMRSRHDTLKMHYWRQFLMAQLNDDLHSKEITRENKLGINIPQTVPDVPYTY